jgi:NhaA family Na+:H+ antiporter
LALPLFAWLAVRTGQAVLPNGVLWRGLVGASCLGGLGFTMSLFIAGLRFGEGSGRLDAAKIGILTASMLAALSEWVLLRRGAGGALTEMRACR